MVSWLLFEAVSAKGEEWDQWEAAMLDQLSRGIRTARKRVGMSQTELAAATGVSQGQIANLEVGRKRIQHLPSVATLYRLAVALGTPPGLLLYPDIPDAPVELWPGAETSSITALEWLSGNVDEVGDKRFDITLAGFARSYHEEKAALEHTSLNDLLARLGAKSDVDPKQAARAMERAKKRLDELAYTIEMLGGTINKEDTEE